MNDSIGGGFNGRLYSFIYCDWAVMLWAFFLLVPPIHWTGGPTLFWKTQKTLVIVTVTELNQLIKLKHYKSYYFTKKCLLIQFICYILRRRESEVSTHLQIYKRHMRRFNRKREVSSVMFHCNRQSWRFLNKTFALCAIVSMNKDFLMLSDCCAESSTVCRPTKLLKIYTCNILLLCDTLYVIYIYIYILFVTFCLLVNCTCFFQSLHILRPNWKVYTVQPYQMLRQKLSYCKMPWKKSLN